MRAPTVGISVCIDRGLRLRRGADYYYVRRDYAQRVHEAGAVAMLLSLDTPPEAAVRLCDALVLTGGDDLPRRLRGERPVLHAEDAERIHWECSLLTCAHEAELPVLGVCYGMQLINLHQGGTLYADISTEHPGAIDHGATGVSRHAVNVEPGTPLLRGLPREVMVNSRHRQAIARLADGFSVTARSSDGVAEAIERHPWYGVEWHPETDATGPVVYGNFVALVRRSLTEGGEP